MSVDFKHPLYEEYFESWVDCRNAYEGQRAIKAEGERYLPRLINQTVAEYEAYKLRALFYSITSKTISALVGMATDIDPYISAPQELDKYFKDDNGLQINEIIIKSLTEILLTGRVGVLVDRPQGGGDPYISLYPTESIINWRTDDTNKLISVVLSEVVDIIGDDGFSVTQETRYRHMYINVDGQLQVDVYTKGQNIEQVYSGTILNYGTPMDYIPFFCATDIGLDIKPVKSPIQDIVDINISHYRSSADLEHGRHFTGLPTPYIVGAESDTKMHIGSTAAWIIPSEKASVGYLEFQGLGLKSLENALKEKQGLLASLSARLIDNNTRGSEAAETVRLRYMSETSSLRTIVRSVEALCNRVFNAVAGMLGVKEDVTIDLDTDFLTPKLTANELKAWTDAYLNGAVSTEMYIYALRSGKTLPPPGEDLGVIPTQPGANFKETGE